MQRSPHGVYQNVVDNLVCLNTLRLVFFFSSITDPSSLVGPCFGVCSTSPYFVLFPLNAIPEAILIFNCIKLFVLIVVASRLRTLRYPRYICVP